MKAQMINRDNYETIVEDIVKEIETVKPIKTTTK